jgi:hypothetical protein
MDVQMATEPTESTEKHGLIIGIFRGFSGFRGYDSNGCVEPAQRIVYSSRRPSEGSTRAERRPARPDATTEAMQVSASAIP